MHQTATRRRTTRRGVPRAVLPLVIAAAAIIGALIYQSASPARSFTLPELPGQPHTHDGLPMPSSAVAPSRERAPADAGLAATARRRGITVDDGALPDGVTVLDGEFPGIASLDPDLRAALREATTDAAGDGVELPINSGWRSAAYQDSLLREAVAQYGSQREAARWVATPDTSPHVSGDAVDIGSDEGTAWLSTHGARHGLCQVYRNEPWHYELRAEARRDRCPPMFADPTHDPRMGR
jgi:hypothetical protein